MPSQETLLTVLLIALAANLGLMILVILAAWIRGRRRRADEAAPITVAPAVDVTRGARDAGPAGGAIVDDELLRREAAEQAAAEHAALEAERSEAERAAHEAERAEAARAEAERAQAAARAAAAAAPVLSGVGPAAEEIPPDLVDPDSGLVMPRLWSHTLTEEMARIARYRHQSSVVLIEVEGLERLVDRFGEQAAERLLPVISETIRKNARAADHVAVLEPGRYGILLTETDEIRAINFIERVRAACDSWLAAGAVALRLAIGWADANAARSIEDALAIAEDRLNADRRRPAFRVEPGPAPGTGAP